MARQFTGSSSQFAEYAGAVASGAPVTLSVWFYMATSISGCPLSIGNNGATNNYFALETQGTGFGCVAWTGGGGGAAGSTTSTHPATNVWNHLCGVFATATLRAAYLNGGGKATNSSSRTPTGLNVTTLGRRSDPTPTQYFTGRIADAAIWSDALTDTEVAAIANGVSPLRIRPASLVGYWPIRGIDSPERDWTANNQQMTLTGTALANHAPVQPYSARFWGSAPLIEVSAGGAPTFRRSSFGRGGSRGAYA